MYFPSGMAFSDDVKLKPLELIEHSVEQTLNVMTVWNYLVHIKIVDDCIKASVEIIQQRHHLWHVQIDK